MRSSKPSVTVDGGHVLLGVNEKLFFPAPSFAIRGGCFTANTGQYRDLEAYVFGLLDAIGFDNGAAHIEIMLTEHGPAVIEINPRLVGARIPRLLSASLQRSVHADLLALHAQGQLPVPPRSGRCAVTRWLSAAQPGVLQQIALSPPADAENVEVVIVAKPGDAVSPAYDNADRLCCVIVNGDDRRDVEALADRIVAESEIKIAAD